MPRAARALIRLLAWLTPARLRARWREEWLAEHDARLDHSARQRWRYVRGAVADAVMTHALPDRAAAPRRSLSYRWLQDLREALRFVSRRPLPAAAAVCCLALGLSVSVATFSVISGVLVGPVPGIDDRASLSGLSLAQPLRARASQEVMGHVWRAGLTVQQVAVLEQSAPAGAVVGGEAIRRLSARVQDGSAEVAVALVTPRYFEALGTDPLAGRLLGVADADQPRAVISERFWRVVLGSRADVLGEVLIVSGEPVQIVGVAPRRFTGWMIPNTFESNEENERPPDMWVPVGLDARWPASTRNRSGLMLETFVRHPATHTRDKFAQTLEPVAAALGQVLEPGEADGWRLGLHRHGWTPQISVSDTLTQAAVMMLAPLTVLLIACVNVANLRLAMTMERLRELAVRLALGATRGEVARLLMFEASILSACSLGLAWFGVEVALWGFNSLLPYPVALDLPVAVLAASLLLLVLLVVGVGPAWLQAGRATAAGLRAQAATPSRAHGRLRHGLVILQLSLSLVLILLGTLFVQALGRQVSGSAASTSKLVVGEVSLADLAGSPVDPGPFSERLLALATAGGQVEAIGVSDTPLFGRRGDLYYRRQGGEFVRPHIARISRVTPGYLQAIGAEVVAGRGFTVADRGRDAAVLSDTAAAVLGAGASPLGQPINIRNGPSDSPESTRPYTVIGVARGIPTIERSSTWTFQDIYLPMAEVPATFWLAARSAAPGESVRDLGRLVAQLEPRGPRVRLESGQEVVARETVGTRMLARISGLLGAGSLLLSAAGIYAVLAYVVSLRRREIGIRMAVGARPRDAVRLILRQTVGLVFAGVCAGGIVGIPLAIALRSELSGLAPLNVSAFIPAVVILAATALLAAALPARRASRVTPLEALREG